MHLLDRKETIGTQEVLFLKKGRLRVDFYDGEQAYLESRILEEGDIIYLVSGGHGFEALEDIEMVEVKTGPYHGADEDKLRFDAIPADQVKIKP
jgi:hypothetical protein